MVKMQSMRSRCVVRAGRRIVVGVVLLCKLPSRNGMVKTEVHGRIVVETRKFCCADIQECQVSEVVKSGSVDQSMPECNAQSLCGEGQIRRAGRVSQSFRILKVVNGSGFG
jgi:hypothetical protein